MSALRVSGGATEEGDLIAASQFCASMAALPAVYSGSSCAPAGASSVASPIAVAGKNARARPRSVAEALPRITPSLARRQPLPHLAQLWALAVRLACEARQLVKVLTRLLRLAGRLRRLGRSAE